MTGGRYDGAVFRGHFDGNCFVGAVLSGAISGAHSQGCFVEADLSLAVLTGYLQLLTCIVSAFFTWPITYYRANKKSSAARYLTTYYLAPRHLL